MINDSNMYVRRNVNQLDKKYFKLCLYDNSRNDF